ncbi:hypothetical protein TIFTF001_024072 [Ficus carica]|uniref:Potassium channel domain-containing protein n=1 Tax=Ficus carica TaxID=3494 RepID=A0AA88DKA9_FICCA|nr:hypothetical protein TIFTF001_024072 [Ficus carica]
MDEPLLPVTTGVEVGESSSPSLKNFSHFAVTSIPQSEPRFITNSKKTDLNSSFPNLLANLKKDKKRKLITRAHSAPSISMSTPFTESGNSSENSRHSKPSSGKPDSSLALESCFGVTLYILIGFATFLISGSFKGHVTVKTVDALYYIVVTFCTTGYGDIVPDSTFTKLFTCFFILMGFGLFDVVLNGFVRNLCDQQESVLLSAMDENRLNTTFETYILDKEKGRMRIRVKVVLALAVVVCCITIGTVAVHFLEEFNWVDSFYFSVTSVTTVGYGDYSFTTKEGRIFGIVWLFVSTFAFGRAFLYLAELRIDKRNRSLARLVLHRKVTVGDLVAVDFDNDGYISKSEYIIFKLKEMRKVTETDILEIGKQFDSLKQGNGGKLTLADIMETEEIRDSNLKYKSAFPSL